MTITEKEPLFQTLGEKIPCDEHLVPADCTLTQCVSHIYADRFWWGKAIGITLEGLAKIGYNCLYFLL